MNPTKPQDIWNTELHDLRDGSHLPALLACVAATTGSILEIGAGSHSTPMLHAMSPNRWLVSAENDPYWRGVFGVYGNGTHTMSEGDGETLNELSSTHWSVVLVDSFPISQRWKSVSLFLPRADYVVVHDAQMEDVMGPIWPLIKKVPNQFMHKRFWPWTLVLSNTRPIPDIP